MMRNLLIVLTISVTSVACSNSNKEVTIFSIPSDVTPSELQEQGFKVHRDLNFLGETDAQHNGQVLYCDMDMIYARISAGYDDDTTRIKNYAINIDIKPFKEMTGLQGKEYKSVEIDGYNYKVKKNDDQLSLYLTRLGL